MTTITDLRTARTGFNDVADLFEGQGGYSTTEYDTGTLAPDGKTVYKKSVSIGTLPNATTKAVAHGITSLYDIIEIVGYATDPTGGFRFTMPHSTTTLNQTIGVYADATNITVLTGIDRTAFTRCYVTLYYTKP